MIVYSKTEVRNFLGQVLWYKDKKYEAARHNTMYVVTCELIANEYPMMTIEEILEKFYTIEDQRDMNISNIINM